MSSVPVEVKCEQCDKKALYVARVKTATGKVDVYECEDEHRTEVEVKE